MNKEVLIVYESRYVGNTLKVAKEFAFAFNCKMIKPEALKKEDLDGIEVVLFGSGIYFGDFDKRMYKAALLIKDKNVCLFSTRGHTKEKEAHAKITSFLLENDNKVFAEYSLKAYSCIGKENLTNGINLKHPNYEDLLNVRKFAYKIMPNYYHDIQKTNAENIVEINYKTLSSDTSFVDRCPMGVFALKDKTPTVVNGDSCIHCRLCQKLEGNNSINISHTKQELINISKYLETYKQ